MLVIKFFLYRSDVISRFTKMGRKTASKCIEGYGFCKVNIKRLFIKENNVLKRLVSGAGGNPFLIA